MRSTASGSPVSVAWFTMAHPCSITPSMHIDMPVRTAIRSPGMRLAAGTLVSESPSILRAESGTLSSDSMSSFSEEARV